MEAKYAEQQLQMKTALATIAKIATRTYYGAQPAHRIAGCNHQPTIINAIIERGYLTGE
jgi:hypothetical protein